MWIFIDWPTTLECLFTALVMACFLTVICFRPLGILQSFGYRCSPFLKWAGKKNNLTQPRFSVLALACLLSCAVISLCFSFAGHFSAVIGLAAYLIFFVLYIVAEVRHGFKTPAALTPRFKRLFVTLWLLFAVLIYLTASVLNFGEAVWDSGIFATLKYCVFAVFPFAALPLICLADCITLIWEKPINDSYVKKAGKKLGESGCKIIGITGSFGKTGAKNILAQMLKTKYNVIATPSSYNTPLGIARAINASDLTGCDFFIAEMGARRKGDIKELCALCPPDYSLITGVCAQHLESFKSLENIIATKGEIITATKNSVYIASDAYGYFDDIQGVKHECDCLGDVSADSTGTSFTLSLGGGSVRVKTKLLGEHAARNIALCAQLAFELGVGLTEIAAAAEGLDYTEHRLQLLNADGVYVLDDGYNSNVVGARAALGVLRTFSGKKIVVTPGLVELGVLEVAENRALGEQLVGLDYVILVGETLVKAVQEGYISAGGDSQKLTVVPTLVKAQDVLKNVIEKGDAVLFLNDLPEQYL